MRSFTGGVDMSHDESVKQELASLRRLAAVVVAWLVASTILAMGCSVALLHKSPLFGIDDWSVQRTLLCVASGMLGSCISALFSAAERIANGWELASGAKYPPPQPEAPDASTSHAKDEQADKAGKKDKFVARMVAFFVVRPFLGAAMGLLIYAGVTSGYLIAVEDAASVTFSRNGLLFFSFLAGLFAKTFVEKLRVTFDTLAGK